MRVKICGLSEPEHVRIASEAGAAYVGFVFFPPSPRAVTAAAASALALEAAPGVGKVGLFVSPNDATLEDVLKSAPLDFLQLHGDETPERVRAVKEAFGLPVIKALGVGDAADVARLDAFEAAADMLLCDAKPAPQAEVPGGTGEAFEWRLLEGRSWAKPWLLAGGLTAETVAHAAKVTGAREVDVSSGVEVSRGVKSPEKIRAFIEAALAA